jgi:anti-sigma regulatory factor (Ser/Thr protein kinase)
MASEKIAAFSVPSKPGGEREAVRLTEEALALYGLPAQQMERIKTAMSEAVLNAMEHGNDNLAHLPVHVQIEVGDECVTISVYDHGMVRTVPSSPVEPDLYAKLAGEQHPRGWGIFLIRSMVDELKVSSEPARHCVEMVFYRGESA